MSTAAAAVGKMWNLKLYGNVQKLFYSGQWVYIQYYGFPGFQHIPDLNILNSSALDISDGACINTDNGLIRYMLPLCLYGQENVWMLLEFFEAWIGLSKDSKSKSTLGFRPRKL